MRFCLLTTFFPPYHFGGDAIFVSHLANALAAARHEVDVVHCADSFELLRGPVNSSPVPLDPKVRVHTLRSQFGPMSPFLTYTTGRPFLKSAELDRILGQHFDVVHWHNLSLVGGPGALCKARGVRLYTLHDYWLLCPTHILFKFNEEACTKRECLRCTLRQRRAPQAWRAGGFLQDALRNVDGFLAPSRFVQQRYRESALGIESAVLPHFVQPRRTVIPDNQRERYYLFVGRLEKAKGVQTILPFFQKPGRRLLIAGSGNYEAELRRLAANSPQIDFLGRIQHEHLSGLYAGAIATLVPSLCFETFGLTILESLQQGTPVITSRYGALPEVVSDTGGGETYGDVTELQAILERFDTSSAYCRRLGQQGRQALGRYSVSAHLDRYFAIIEELRGRKATTHDGGGPVSLLPAPHRSNSTAHPHISFPG